MFHVNWCFTALLLNHKYIKHFMGHGTSLPSSIGQLDLHFWTLCNFPPVWFRLSTYVLDTCPMHGSHFILWKTFRWDVLFEHRCTTPETNILLMAEILHQLIAGLPPYIQGFIHPWWCRISSINSIAKQLGCPKAPQFHGGFGQIFRPTPPGRSGSQGKIFLAAVAKENNSPTQVVFITGWWFQPLWKILVKMEIFLK